MKQMALSPVFTVSPAVAHLQALKVKISPFGMKPLLMQVKLDASQESCNTKLRASCRLKHGRIQPLYKIFTFMSLHVLCNRHFLSVQRKGVQTLFVLRAPSGIHLSWVAGAECCPWTASRLATHLMGHQLELLLNQNCEMAHLQDTTQFLRQIPCSK